MAIRLVCPACGTDRFKAPNRARGKRCRCPECRSSFRLTDDMRVLEWGNVPNRDEPETFPLAPDGPEPAAETRAAATTPAPTRPEPAAAPSAPQAAPTPPSVPAVADVPRRSRLIPRDPGDQFALAAAGLTGLGLVATTIPYGRAGTVLFAGLGV